MTISERLFDVMKWQDISRPELLKEMRSYDCVFIDKPDLRSII